MAKKQNAYYFDNFIKCAEYSAEAAKLLKEFINNYDDTKLEECMEKMHTIEHAADLKKHEMTEVLVKAFITPIDREDIISVSQNLDDLTDKLEEVLLRLYLNHVSEINPRMREMTELVEKATEEILALMCDFADFKHSKSLKEHIININSLEEKADKLYMANMHSLQDESSDALYIIAWRDIYNYLERCTDTAEHIADIVESVIMKNS